MARRRFFVDRIQEGLAEITGERAWHLARVLRAQPGQVYELSDNQRVYLGRVELATKDRVLFQLLAPLPAELPPLRLTLLLALIKFDRFEWALEKVTELGVERVVPIITSRSEKGLELGARKRLARWERIALEAAQQARRSFLPRILPPTSLEQALYTGEAYRYRLEELPGTPHLLAVLPPDRLRRPEDQVAILVGPEGGWTDRERELATGQGWQAASLGPFILRAETAAMAAVALLSGAWAAAPRGCLPIPATGRNAPQ